MHIDICNTDTISTITVIHVHFLFCPIAKKEARSKYYVELMLSIRSRTRQKK